MAKPWSGQTSLYMLWDPINAAPCSQDIHQGCAAPQAGRNASIGKRCAVGEQKEELLSALRSTAVRAGAGTPRDGGAAANGNARRSLSLRRNLSTHLDQVRVPPLLAAAVLHDVAETAAGCCACCDALLLKSSISVGRCTVPGASSHAFCSVLPYCTQPISVSH